jgi:hypothetical protein
MDASSREVKRYFSFADTTPTRAQAGIRVDSISRNFTGMCSWVLHLELEPGTGGLGGCPGSAGW